MPRAGFFTIDNSHLRAEPKHPIINVGGEQFQALAVGLIDYFKRSPRLNDATLKKILERFYFHFPKYISNQPYLTASERMSMLVNGQRTSEIVGCKAYVLRQLAVDEIYSNPLSYRDVFHGLQRNTPQSYLRQTTTPLSVSSMEACAMAIGVNISLSFVDYDKELRKRVVFSGNPSGGAHSGIAIQVQQDCYYPAVKNKSDFAYVGQIAVNGVKPIEKISSNPDATIADMVDEIAAEDKVLLQSYHKWQQNLLTMVQLEEISQANLLSLYIKYLPVNNGTIVTPNQLFARLMQSEKQVVEMDGSQKRNQFHQSLASSLAQWISLNLVDAEELFEQLEQRPASKSISAL